jgi:hypothetical protein
MCGPDLFLTSAGIRNVPWREVALWLVVQVPELAARPRVSKKNDAVTWCIVTPACQEDADRLQRAAVTRRLQIKGHSVLVRPPDRYPVTPRK